MNPAERYPAVLLLVFGAIWAALAIAPSYRQDWLLENVLIFVAVPLLVATSRTLRFSNAANFATAFRRWTGVTPGEFRRHMKRKS